MDKKLSQFFVCSIALPILSLGAVWQLSSAASNKHSEVLFKQQSYQETTITVSNNEYKHPLYLEIKTPKDTKLTGKVFLEEQTIAKLNNNLTIDLSPQLQSGKNTIEIIGNYEPESNLVTVTVKSKHTQSTTSTGGNGIVRQKLIIDVI